MSDIRETFEVGAENFHRHYGVMDIPQNATGLSNKQRSLLDVAVRAAEASEVDQRHGSVVVKSGRVMSIGVNKWRNRDLLKPEGGYNTHLTVHAEIDALSRVTDARGAVVYIARVGKDGSEKFSRPCDRCAKALQDAGVKQVIYTIG